MAGGSCPVSGLRYEAVHPRVAGCTVLCRSHAQTVDGRSAGRRRPSPGRSGLPAELAPAGADQWRDSVWKNRAWPASTSSALKIDTPAAAPSRRHSRGVNEGGGVAMASPGMAGAGAQAAPDVAPTAGTDALADAMPYVGAAPAASVRKGSLVASR